MNCKSQITTKKIKKVKSNLPLNGMEEIANRLDIPLTSVRNVFLGRNQKCQREVLEKALEIIDLENKKNTDLSNKIDKL